MSFYCEKHDLSANRADFSSLYCLIRPPMLWPTVHCTEFTDPPIPLLPSLSTYFYFLPDPNISTLD